MPDFQRRKRLKSFDYSAGGAYFVTICTNRRARLFGGIVGKDTGAILCGRPNEPHQMILKWLWELENKFDHVTVDECEIMPYHIHFILFFSGDHAGAPVRMADRDGCGFCARASLPQVVGWFKTMTTSNYIRGVKAGIYSPFEGHLWQRSHYDHVIRNETDLYEIRRYIRENPARWAARYQS